MEFLKALWNDIQRVFGREVTLGTNTITTLNIIVWSLFIGFFIAIVITLYNKIVIGSAVRKLLKKKAHSENEALSASELGCKNVFIRFAFRKNSTLRKMLCTADGSADSVKKHNMEDIKFYVPQKSVKKLEVIYGKNGVTVGNIILAIIALVIVALIAFTVADKLITMTSDFTAGISEGNDVQ